MQSGQAELIQKENTLFITGDLDFVTVPDLQRQSTGILKSAGLSVCLDLSQVTNCNSAGIALLLEMSRQARNNRQELKIINLPASLMTIARAYGMESEIREVCQ